MNWQEYFSFLTFVTVFYGTPGPATISIAASGSAFGFRRSMPYVAGIVAGVAVNLAVVVTGLGYLLDQYPQLQTLLKFLSISYILYIAYQIATGDRSESRSDRALGFWQGLLLNSLNPKAYVAAIFILSQFAGPQSNAEGRLVVIVTTILIVATIVDIGWCYLGHTGQKWLHPRTAGTVNRVLAVALVASFLAIIFSSPG